MPSHPAVQAAQQLHRVMPRAHVEELAKVLRQVLRPAGVVGVLRSGQRQVVGVGLGAAFGPPEHLSFELASVTKPFTAALVVHLAQQSGLNLGAALSRQRPEFQGYPPHITAQALLTHTSGLPLHPLRGALGQLTNFHNPYAALSPAEVLASGRRWAWATAGQAGKLGYSNFGYGLLAIAAAALSGEPYFTALGRHIVLPLGLTHTAETPRTPLATPHNLLGSRQVSGFGGLTGAGGLYSSADNLLSFAQAHLQGPLHGWADFAAPPNMPPELLGVARGWFVGQLGQEHEAVWWHDGVARGTRTLLAFCPETKSAACVLVSSGVPLGGKAGNLLRVLAALRLGER